MIKINLEPEIRKGYYISADMKKVWAVEIDMLNKLLEVCKKYNLRIWAEGGTLLGAVREHGYIPWDDDIDMCMPRDDYDKLQSIAGEEFKSPFFFQTGYTDYFPSGMAKLRKDGTAAIERKNVFSRLHQGIFIDIFPLDAVPKESVEMTLFIDEIANIRRNLYLYCKNHIYSLTNWKYNLMIFKNSYHIWRKGFYNAYKDFEKYVVQYNHNESYDVSLISWGFHERYVRNRGWYNETIWMPFEQGIIPIPIGYHEILTKQFGDYMRPQQIPSVHKFEFLSPDISFSSVLPILRNNFNQERWRVRKKNILTFLGFQ